MRIYYRTGTALPADIIRQLIPSHSDHGETTASDLVGVMRIFGLSPVGMAVPPNAIRPTLVRALAADIPPIVLGTWLAADTLHWVLGVGWSQGRLVVNDPWSGSRRHLSADDLTTRYAGWVIV